MPPSENQKAKWKILWESRKGMRFSSLVVQGRGKNGGALCLCDCGQKITEGWTTLVRGIRKSCGCKAEYYKNLGPRKTHGLTGSYTFRLWHTAKQRAALMALPFDLTMDDVIIPAVCPVLKLPLKQIPDGKRTFNSPSIDRFDNTRGYVRGNIRIISWRANCLKSDMNPLEARALADYMEGKL